MPEGYEIPSRAITDHWHQRYGDPDVYCTFCGADKLEATASCPARESGLPHAWTRRVRP